MPQFPIDYRRGYRQIQKQLEDIASLLVSLDHVIRVVGPCWLTIQVRNQSLLAPHLRGLNVTLQELLSPECIAGVASDAVQLANNFVKAFNFAAKKVTQRKHRLSRDLLLRANKQLQPKQKKLGDINSSSQSKRSREVSSTPIEGDGDPYLEGREVNKQKLYKWLDSRPSRPALVRSAFVYGNWLSICPLPHSNLQMASLAAGLVLTADCGLARAFVLGCSTSVVQKLEQHEPTLESLRSGNVEQWVDSYLLHFRNQVERLISTAELVADVVHADRERILQRSDTRMPAVRIFERLLFQPVINVKSAMELLGQTKPTAAAGIKQLIDEKILTKITRGNRNKLYSYKTYIEIFEEN